MIKRTETLEIPRVSEVRCDFLFWALGEDKPKLQVQLSILLYPIIQVPKTLFMSSQNIFKIPKIPLL